MLTNTYAPKIPFQAIIFDCDGTLSHIEGIDEIAKTNGVGEKVAQLTADAMGSSGMSPELYQERLNLVSPNAVQVQTLGDIYFQHNAPDLLPILKILHNLNKTIYIVSAGLYPAVVHFGGLLGIEKKNIFAVDIYFNSAGNYEDFDKDSPLVCANGKRRIVEQLKQRHQQLAYVGDGLTDYETYDLVTRFIGYGGAFFRENIAQACQYYIAASSMAPLVPLCLTAEEIIHLSPDQLKFYHQGLSLLSKKF